MRATAVALLLSSVLAACAPARAAAPRASLPPDSLELLERALERVRPAYDTQAEALRSGLYERGLASRDAAADRSAPETPTAAPVAPTHPAPATPPPPLPRPAPAPAPPPAEPPPTTRPPSPTHAYVVQIAAFRDETSARVAADDARRTFPLLSPLVEQADGWFRVSLAGWADEQQARAALPAIREIYSSAWIRQRSVP